MIEHDKHSGLIKIEIDSKLVIDMIHTLTLKEYFRAGLDVDLFLKRVSGIIKIVKEGITNV